MTAEIQPLLNAAGAPSAGPLGPDRWPIIRSMVLGGVLVVLILVTGAIQPNYLIGQRASQHRCCSPLRWGSWPRGRRSCMLTGGIDLSVAMIATGAAYVAGNRSPSGAAIAIVFGLMVGLLAGAANGVGVGVFQVNPLIMTLAMSAILLGLFTSWAQTIFTGSTTVAPFIKRMGGGSFLGNRIPYNALVWALVALLIMWMLQRTGLGRLIYAVGDNPMAARLSGVRIWQVHLAVYTIAGMLAALAGIILAGRTGAVDLQLASSFLLPSVAAAVIGGTSIFGGVGSYSGTILGALILAVLNSMLTFLNAGQAIQQVVYGLIVLALAWLYARVTAER